MGDGQVEEKGEEDLEGTKVGHLAQGLGVGLGVRGRGEKPQQGLVRLVLCLVDQRHDRSVHPISLHLADGRVDGDP